VLPVEVRRALGVGEGDELIALLENDGVHLRTREAVMASLRAAFGEGERSPLDDLMELRRVEREREAREREADER
jgi:bifunctional DNA-binding transcriptional regulator/antitoxin component of YhaV-PrlF toxin-antitoxin module